MKCSAVVPCVPPMAHERAFLLFSLYLRKEAVGVHPNMSHSEMFFLTVILIL